MMTFDRKKFFAAYKAQVGSPSKVEVKHLNDILDNAEKDARLDSLRQLAYMIATARWETRRFERMREEGPRSYFEQYEGKGGNKPGEGFTFRGNGWCHMTFRNNHVKALKKLTELGIMADVVGDPDSLWKNPEANYNIMVSGHLEGWFTSMKLGDYVNDLKADYRQARVVINPGELYIADGKWKAKTAKRRQQCVDAVDTIVAWAKGCEAALRAGEVTRLEEAAALPDNNEPTAAFEPKVGEESTLQPQFLETAKLKAGDLAKASMTSISASSALSWFTQNRWLTALIFVLVLAVVGFIFRTTLRLLGKKVWGMLTKGM